MNLFDFDIIYKKGSKMPADYLSHNFVPLTNDLILLVCQDIYSRFPKVKRKRLSRENIQK